MVAGNQRNARFPRYGVGKASKRVGVAVAAAVIAIGVMSAIVGVVVFVVVSAVVAVVRVAAGVVAGGVVEDAYRPCGRDRVRLQPAAAAAAAATTTTTTTTTTRRVLVLVSLLMLPLLLLLMMLILLVAVVAAKCSLHVAVGAADDHEVTTTRDAHKSACERRRTRSPGLPSKGGENMSEGGGEYVHVVRVGQ